MYSTDSEGFTVINSAVAGTRQNQNREPKKSKEQKKSLEQNLPELEIPIVIKKATDRIKITPASQMSKRSFGPKKKLPFKTEKYAAQPEQNTLEQANTEHSFDTNNH